MEKNKWDFWKYYLYMENTRPLLGFLWEPDVKPLKSIVERVGIGNTLKPSDFILDDIEEHVSNVLGKINGWETDFEQAISVNLGTPWIEAIIGCKLIVQKDSIWAEPPENDYQAFNSLIIKDSTWIEKLTELHKYLVRISANRFPVSLPVMHGPLDIMSAFRDPTNLSLDLYDRPEDVKSSAENLKDLWIELAARLMKVIPPFQSGWFTRMNLYMESKCATPQADFTSLISEKMYREFGLRIDQEIMKKIPSQTYHTHSTSAHVLKTIADIPNLKSLQVTIDPNGPSLKEMRDILAECQKKVPVLLAVWTTHDFKWFAENLSPAGLAIVLIKDRLTGKDEYNRLRRSVVNFL